MTVKQLAEELGKFPDDMEMWVCDELEGNGCPASLVQLIPGGGYNMVPSGEVYNGKQCLVPESYYDICTIRYNV